jgi:glycine betaine/proline transport system substrate-binding protein
MLSTLKSALVATTLIASASVASGQSIPESTDPIKVVLNDWTGQLFSANVAGLLLQEMGYTVEYVSAGALPQHVGLQQGNLHFVSEVWSNNVGDIYPNALAAGEVVNLGSLGLDLKEGWVYPPYMEEACPGLPDYRALYECAPAFAAPDTFPKGRLITYPADWGTRSRDLVASIDMPLEPIAGGSEGAMIAELRSAIDAQQPILMMMYQPHWIFSEYELNFVEWNPIEGECVEESQERETACGFQQATADKVVWGGFEAEWPAAYRMLSALTLTNADENAAILAVDTQGAKVEDIAADWVAKNEATWKPWIEQALQ